MYNFVGSNPSPVQQDGGFMAGFTWNDKEEEAGVKYGHELDESMFY